MAARASTRARARGLASGAEAGKELEHGAVEGFGLIPGGEAVDPQAVGRRDLRHACLPLGACAGGPGAAGPWGSETPMERSFAAEVKQAGPRRAFALDGLACPR